MTDEVTDQATNYNSNDDGDDGACRPDPAGDPEDSVNRIDDRSGSRRP